MVPQSLLSGHPSFTLLCQTNVYYCVVGEEINLCNNSHYKSCGFSLSPNVVNECKIHAAKGLNVTDLLAL